MVCPICFEEKKKNITFQCRDRYCISCIKTYIQSEFKNFNLNIKCPNYRICKHELSKIELAQFLDSKEMRNKYDDIIQNKYLDTLSIFYCKCGEAYEVEGKQNVCCIKCLKKSCSSCSLPPHSGECIRVPRDQLELVEKGIIKHCPNCKVIIEKNMGCNKMRCIKCNHGFYWDTLEKREEYKPRVFPEILKFGANPKNLWKVFPDGWGFHPRD